MLTTRKKFLAGIGAAAFGSLFELRSSFAQSSPAHRWKGAATSKIKRWDVITLGNLSRNRYWGEGDAKGVRPAICTCTVFGWTNAVCTTQRGHDPPKREK